MSRPMTAIQRIDSITPYNHGSNVTLAITRNIDDPDEPAVNLDITNEQAIELVRNLLAVLDIELCVDCDTGIL